MRKKEIEKITPLPVEKVSRKFKLVVSAARVKVGKDDNLIVDFYYNKKSAFKKPYLRMAIAPTDYANYMNGKWNSKGIFTRNYRDIWNEDIEVYQDRIRDEEIYIDEASEKIIENYVKVVDDGYSPNVNRRKWDKMPWKTDIRRMQDHIDYIKQDITRDNKRRLMQTRMAAVQAPPKEFIDFGNRKLTTMFMYYKRKNKREVELICSECGVGYTRVFKASDIYERAMTERVIEPPINNGICKCEWCGATGIYKQYGKYKNTTTGIDKAMYMIEPYENNIAVVRYFQFEKYLSVDRPARYAQIEKGRLFVGPNLYQKYWSYRQWNVKKEDTIDWTWNNPGGHWDPVKDEEGYLWPDSNIKDTFLKYSAINQYGVYGVKEFKPYVFAERYKGLPELEMLIKLDMRHMVEEIMLRGVELFNLGGKDIYEKLGIDKKNFKELIYYKGNWQMYRIMQHQKKLGVDMSAEQRRKLAPYVYQLENTKLGKALQYMSITQFIHRVEKYSEREMSHYYRDGEFKANEIIKHNIIMYLDYLDMRDRLHHDLNNSVRVYPKHLRVEHDRLVVETNENKDRDFIAKKQETYSEIAEQFEQLSKKYNLEYAGLIIRPAQDAKEIIMEGRLQHHCVGGDNYLDKHNRGVSTILLLRHIETPDTPYVTIEIKDKQIVQWYEAYDKQPHKEEIEPWLKKYVNYLKTRRKPKEKHTDETLKAAV